MVLTDMIYGTNFHNKIADMIYGTNFHNKIADMIYGTNFHIQRQWCITDRTNGSHEVDNLPDNLLVPLCNPPRKEP